MHADFHRRRVTVDDLDAVAALLTASDLSVLGRTDFTRAELEVDLRNAETEHEGWYDDAGALVAYGWVRRVGDSARIELDASVRPDHPAAVGAALLAGLEQRGRALAAEAGHGSAVLDIGVYRQDGRTRAWMQSRGFTVGTTFTRMRIDFEPGAPADAVPPPGVRLRRAEDSETDLALAHRLHEQSFAEHYGHVPEALDHFRGRLLEHGPGWATVWLADLDGKPVGLLVGTPQFVEDENCGYVRTLGVGPAARGRGVARALLLRYFTDQQVAGRAGVLLHVDVANVTNALALYESVGMRPVLEIDAWAKQVAVTTSG